MTFFFGHLGRLPLRATSTRHSALCIPCLRNVGSPVLMLMAAPNLRGVRGKKTRREAVPDLAENEEGFRVAPKGKKARFSVASMEEDALPWVTFLEQAEGKMRSVVDRFVKELAMLETRAGGRVNPSLLDSIHIPSTGNRDKLKLSEVATVGVKEGYTLVITLFDDKVGRHAVLLLTQIAAGSLRVFSEDA